MTQTSGRILRLVDESISENGEQRVVVFFSRSAAGSGANPTGLQLLPVDLRRFHALEAQPWPTRNIPGLAGDHEAFLHAVLREHIFCSLHRACAESLASEHAVRLAAMQLAERRIEEYEQELLCEYRVERQAQITSELLDVVGGFEVLAEAS